MGKASAVAEPSLLGRLGSVMRLGYSKTSTVLMLVGICWSTYVVVTSPPPWQQALFLFVLCVVLTDLISGVLHVILDNPRSLEVGFLRGLAEGFQRHHQNPAKIYEMPLYEHLYVMHLPLMIVFILVAFFADARMHVVALSMVFALHLMQMAHLWAHVPPEKVPAPVRLLQRGRLLLSKAQHDVHHTPPHDRDFCIMTGMCNRPLNAVVRVVGGTTHWWNAAFLAVAASPLAVAFWLAYLR